MMTDRTKEIFELRQRLDELEKAQKAWEGLPKSKQLAEMLHHKLCKADHTDQCGWCYESWDKMRGQYSERRRYLEKAEKILQIAKFDTVVKILNEL